MSWFDECDLEYLIGDLKDKNAKLRNEVELTKRMYAKVSEDLCAEQADNERLRQELAICEESEQEKCIECLRQENIDWEDRYRTLANESAKLRELVEHLQPTDCEGNALDIADTVSMLRSEYDGDHEWDDVVVELALTKWGGDRWIVRGSKGEAWACDCLKTGYDEDAYEGSDDVEPIDNPSLIEVENAKLRDLVRGLLTDPDEWDYDYFTWRIEKLGIEVE